jgi:hypothetical protein
MAFRTLRAFAWMRWRVLANSLERTDARDSLQRFSIAVEQVAPFIALALVVPSCVGLAGLGGYAGYWLAAGQQVMAFEALRILLFAGCGFAIVGPLLLPSMEPTAIVRLLLLPIPRRTLYAAQTAGAVSEPWTLISLPIALSIPIGLAIGGAWLAAAIALVAGLLLILCIVGLSTVSTLLLHLVARDRRRGELVALVFVVLVPLLSMLPAFLSHRPAGRGGEVEHSRRSNTPPPWWIARPAAAAFAVVPSELAVRATRSSARHEPAAAILPLLALVLSGGVLHALGLLTFGRLLDSPSAATRRAAATDRGAGSLRLPFLSRTTTAVAQAHIRLAVRSPRGRSVLISPFIVCVVVAAVINRQGQMQIGEMTMANGLIVAALAGALCLLSLHPFTMNQFAIDGSGLTLALLSPLAAIELLAGKAVGNGLLAGGPAIACMLVALVLAPGGAPALWLTLPPALVATYLLVAPGAAALSAIFPKAVDLNSISRGSNPHSFASVLGLLVVTAAALPSVLLFVLMTWLVRVPALTPIVMLAWCGLTVVVSRWLFARIVVLFENRKENLGLVVA